MADPLAAFQRNREVADRINEEARKDPASPLVGKFVGIVDGEVVTVAGSLEEAMRRLRQTGDDPSRIFCFEAGLDYSQVVEMWSPC